MGLRHKELEGMVIPLISVDEFEPKIGTNEEAIVIAFFCKDELPSYDLDEFIDKSVVEFLDSEVSPNPNEQGHYLVFVEFKRQPNFWLKFYDLVKDIENIAGNLDWKVQPYLVDELYDLKDRDLHDVVITKQEEYVPRKEFDSTVEEYVQDSNLLNFERDESHMKLGGRHGSVVVEFVDFGDANKVADRLQLKESHINLDTSVTATALRGVLGKNWDVTNVDDYYFITKDNSDRTLVVKET